MGPIRVFLLEFQNFQTTGGVVAELSKLSGAKTIRLVDARFLVKESESEQLALRDSNLAEDEREELRAAAGAWIGIGAGAVLGSEGGAVKGALLGAEAALAAGPVGCSDEDVETIGEAVDVGDALLLVVAENVWATGLRNALRETGLVYMEQDYLTLVGLVALGQLFGIQAATAG